MGGFSLWDNQSPYDVLAKRRAMYRPNFGEVQQPGIEAPQPVAQSQPEFEPTGPPDPSRMENMESQISRIDHPPMDGRSLLQKGLAEGLPVALGAIFGGSAGAGGAAQGVNAYNQEQSALEQNQRKSLIAEMENERNRQNQMALEKEKEKIAANSLAGAMERNKATIAGALERNNNTIEGANQRTQDTIEGANTRNSENVNSRNVNERNRLGESVRQFNAKQETGGFNLSPGQTHYDLQGKPIASNADIKPFVLPSGSTLASRSGATIATGSPKQPTAKTVQLMIPNGTGGYTLGSFGPGDTIPEGAVSSSGVNQLNMGTQTMRTSAARADVALDGIQSVMDKISANQSKLGPIMGRWNDFMQGKVGSDNPEFAALRTDLMFLTTSAAMTHAIGRLPENLREEFNHVMNAPQQTPQNLLAVMSRVKSWLEVNKEIMGGATQRIQNKGRQQVAGNASVKVQRNSATGQYRYSTDGGKTWQQGKPPNQ
jgi:hypothetical protein